MASPFYVIERTSTLPVCAEEAFAWHERAGAFERLAPPWERFEVLERTGGIHDGARTTFRVHIGPVPLRWVAAHRDYIPGRRFVDEQVEGPFAHWVHQHLFEPGSPGASRYTDRIEFTPPFGTLGAAAGIWLVRPRAERMLAYRHPCSGTTSPPTRRFRDQGPLHVAVTGASGLIGSALAPFLTTGGHRVTPVTRRATPSDAIRWDPSAGAIDVSAFEGLDAVVHLAGENVGGRWTDERKRRIRESRVAGTQFLAEALAELKRPPRVLVCGVGDGDLRRPGRRDSDRGQHPNGGLERLPGGRGARMGGGGRAGAGRRHPGGQSALRDHPDARRRGARVACCPSFARARAAHSAEGSSG